jgi:transcriptional regulator with XRE-family HTH domain
MHWRPLSYTSCVNSYRERRRRLGLSQEAVADRAGIHQQAVSRAERGVPTFQATRLCLEAALRELENER